MYLSLTHATLFDKTVMFLSIPSTKQGNMNCHLLRAFPLKNSSLDYLISSPSTQLVCRSFSLPSSWEIFAVLSCTGSSVSWIIYLLLSGFTDLVLLGTYSKIPELAYLKMSVFYPFNWLGSWLGIEFRSQCLHAFNIVDKKSKTILIL